MRPLLRFTRWLTRFARSYSRSQPLLLNLLARELSNEVKELSTRQLAGVLLKNCLTAKSAEQVQLRQAAWLAISPAERHAIKTAVLGALASPQQSARHTAAQVIGAIGVTELPHAQWPELIQGLADNTTASGNDFLKQSSLEALGFVCEEIDPAVLEPQASLILTAVVSGMRKEEPNMDVRLAGVKAMQNALEFVEKNFEVELERNYIMQTVCEATQAERQDVKVAAYECIVRIAELYYDKLPAYMPALYQLTLAALQKATADESEEEVGKQAIEFWTTICDEEMEIEDEEAPGPSHNFVKQGMGQLVGLLLEAMCKQDEDEDGGYTLSIAAATCLTQIALTVHDEVVGHVIPFIQANIDSADWHRTEAATLAWGSVLDGPSDGSLQPFMVPALEKMISLVGTPTTALPVRDTAAWTIARICEHHTASIQPQHWHVMLREGSVDASGALIEPEGVLLMALKDHTRVAEKVLIALYALAEQVEDERNKPSNLLSGLFVTLAKALLACTERHDAGENNLRVSAYEALSQVITNAAKDTHVSVSQLLPLVISRLEGTFAMPIVSSDDKEAQTELQGLLCATLQVITQKLGAQAAPHADQMMNLCLQVFASRNSSVHEEALLAVGSVATATGHAFEKYMPHFRPFLSLGLSNYEEYTVCNVAIGVVGDICRALEKQVMPYCDELVHLLLRNLQNPALNRNVKPPILSCFGDIALAIEGGFEKYMQVTMSMLVQASQTTVDTQNPDLVEYLNQLREGIFEAYTGVLQGLRAENKATVFEPYMMGALELIRVCNDGVPQGVTGDSVVHAAVGLIGDLAQTLGEPFKRVAKSSPHKEYLKALLKHGKDSPNQETKEAATWASKIAFKD